MSDQHPNPGRPGTLDAVIVGAGFAGMYMLYRLRGLGFSVRVFEAGSGVGGTWYWNRYPGARCDVESMQYSYQFSEELQQEWVWSERYAAQPEILRYANHVADRFDLRRDVQFDTRVHSAVFDEVNDHWVLEVGDHEPVTATHCIMATGCLSSANTPKFAGADSFQGKTYHTGNWPHEGVNFGGQRVGIIGTGSSAIQSIPIIARQAAHLYVFQRTPNYMIPAHNGPLDPAYQAAVKADYAGLRARAKATYPGLDFKFNTESALEIGEEERQREFEERWPMAASRSWVRLAISSIIREPTNWQPSSCAAKSARLCTIPRSRRGSRRKTSSGASGSASIPIIGRPITGRTSR
jgi:cation diffusion facilitator CzcD-associated flavoprotein CzcO